MADVDNFEIENPAIKDVMNQIARKVGGALPDGWGFMLMIFEYGGPDGANFYTSSADRGDVVPILEHWIRRQRLAGYAPIDDVLNPEHQKARDQS